MEITIREYEYGDALNSYVNPLFHENMTSEDMENRMSECYKKFTCIFNKKIVWFVGIDEDNFVFVNFNGVPSIASVKLLLKNIKIFLTDSEYKNAWTTSLANETIYRFHKFIDMIPVSITEDGYIVYKFRR